MTKKIEELSVEEINSVSGGNGYKKVHLKGYGTTWKYDKKGSKNDLYLVQGRWMTKKKFDKMMHQGRDG